MSTDATDVDHCEVAFNADDGFEFFGGTVTVKDLSALFVGDDSVATTEFAAAEHAALASSLALSTTVAIAIPTAFSTAITTTITAAFTSAIASAFAASTVTFTTICRVCVVTLMHNATKCRATAECVS
jgi:ribosomal protein L40E